MGIADAPTAPRTPRSVVALLVVIPSALAVAIDLYATRWGAGMSPDSVIYVHAARQLARGEGLTTRHPHGAVVAVTKYPPLYPSFLAMGPIAFGTDVVPFSRYAGAALMAGLVALTAGMVYAVTRSATATLIAGALAAVAPHQLETGSYALSEVLYTIFQLLALWSVARYLATRRLRWLVIAALGTAACCMTRYVGHLLIPLFLLCIVTLGHGVSLRRRATRAAVFLCVAALPSFLWILRNRTVGDGTDTGMLRELGWHPIGARHVVDLLNTLSGWMFNWGGIRPWDATPIRAANLAVFGCAACASVLLIGLETRRRLITDRAGSTRSMLLACLTVVGAAYVPALIVSISTIDPLTPLDFRLLAPLYPIAVVLASAAVVIAWRASPTFAPVLGAGVKALCAASLLLMGWSYLDRTVAWARVNHADGYRLHYHARPWHESDVTAALRRLPPDALIWTNVNDAVYLHTGRVVYKLPPAYAPDGATKLESYASQISVIRLRMLERPGAIVLYRRSTRRTQPKPEDLARDLNGLVRFDYDEGMILLSPELVDRDGGTAAR